jgi:hypothetical protein
MPACPRFFPPPPAPPPPPQPTAHSQPQAAPIVPAGVAKPQPPPQPTAHPQSQTVPVVPAGVAKPQPPPQPTAHSQPQAAPVVPADVAKPQTPPQPTAHFQPPMPAAPMAPSPRVAAPETEQRSEAGAPAADLGPLALVARKIALPPDVAGSAFSVPFGAGVGATALRRGEVGLVVFDEKRPIDLAALRDDPVFGSASVQMLPAATIIRVRLPVGREIVLSRATPDAWTVAVSATPARFHPIQAGGEGGTLLLSADAPGQVVSIVDPESGAVLLLGTQRQPGQGVAVFRRTPQFGLLPTWQGVAVQPLADSLTLHAVKRGFVLAGGDTRLALAMPADLADTLAGAAALTRRFDFPQLSSLALLRHMQAQLSDAVMSPPLARGVKRLALARTMIALGLGVEAQAVLRVAAEDDPRIATGADMAGLAAVAALVAGRTDEADAIEDPRLTGSDEVTLWRAVRAARRDEGSPQAAAAFTATLALALSYPETLRDRLLPLALETMVAGGEPRVAALFLAAHGAEPALALARAMQHEAAGDADGALAIYDLLALNRDRRLRAGAAVRAVELRLASGRIDKRSAADALDRLLFVWRGDRQELDLRERLATLRAETGAWRPALALLRESGDIFPEQLAECRRRMQDIFAALLRDGGAETLSPLDLVALVDENADLLADEAAGAGVQARLADKLLALDLPRRAAPVLEKLMQSAPPGAGRAGFGASLAALKLREGDPAGALATLFASAATDLPAPLTEQRILLFAAASARTGERDKALAALSGLSSPAADEARATILEQARDWAGATNALAEYVRKTTPTDGALDEVQRRRLVRLASAATQAGDETALAGLRAHEMARMGSGPLADMFRVLIADPVHGVADLQRAAQETALMRALPQGLRALDPTTRTP